MVESKDHYDLVSQVIGSQYRKQVVVSLREHPKTPSAIDGDNDELANVSRALKELTDSGITELLVPEDRKKGRIYGLTEKGEEVAETLQEWDE